MWDQFRVLDSGNLQQVWLLLEDGRFGDTTHDTQLYCLKLFSCDDDFYINRRSKDTDEWFLVLQKSVEEEGVYEILGVGVWNSHCDRRVKKYTQWDASLLFSEYEIDTITII